MRHAVVGFLGLVLTIHHSSAAGLVKNYQGYRLNQATAVDFADPSIYEQNGVHYAYATTAGGRNVQIAVSTDFEDWAVFDHVDALPTVGKWVDQGNPGVWAPSVIKNDAGKYVLYYAAKAAGKDKHCVGAAVGDSPMGPFAPQDKALFCDVAQGGAIDPEGFQDTDGKRYIVYKVDGNSVGHGGICGNTVEPIHPTPIMLQPVQGDGYSFSGKKRQILDRTDLDGPLVEAPQLVKMNHTYILFFSSWCYMDPTYDISYAIADNIWGPYQRRGPLLMTRGLGMDLISPGGATATADGKRMVFHANSLARDKGRWMFSANINIRPEDGVVSFAGH